MLCSDCANCTTEALELTLVDSARNGNPEAFSELFRRYHARLVAVSRRYFARGYDRDDIIQEAMIGFFKAVRDYKADRGTFPAFAELCMLRQIITFIKAASRQKHALLNWAVSLDAPIFDDSSEDLVSRLPVADERDCSEMNTFLSALLGRCSQLERSVLAMYAMGYTFADMAFELGVKWKAIDSAVWRVKVKARKLLAECEYESITNRYTWKDFRAS